MAKKGWPSYTDFVKADNLHFKNAQKVPVGGVARTVGVNKPKASSAEVPGRTVRNFSHTQPKERG